MMTTKSQSVLCPLVPAKRLDGLSPYMTPAQSPFVDLVLDANEGAVPSESLMKLLAHMDATQLCRYPSTARLGQEVAKKFGIEVGRVVITNGADDAIDRVCRVMLEPGRELLTHTPTFEMIERGARLAGGSVRSIKWIRGPFPVRSFIDSLSRATSLVALVSPNNPTGGVIALSDMRAVARAAQAVGAMVLVDLAYVEFADEDPTLALLDEPNVVVVRTFSKAMGLAGARIGFALSSSKVACWLRTAGGPYPVSSVSLALASVSLETTEERRGYIDRVRSERGSLVELLLQLGCAPLESQGNFVSAEFFDEKFVHRALMSLGISVRKFTARPAIDGFLRITLPGNKAAFDRLELALRTILDPEAIFFDLDGVLADVSQSYRVAIIETARLFGVELTPDDISEAKLIGEANNDWELTKRLIEQRNVSCDLCDVIARFQEIYAGTPGNPGLRESECLIPEPEMVRRLGDRFKLAIITGRPRNEAEWFLNRAGLREQFSALVCMEDAPAKPSTEPVQRALNEVGVQRAWMIGDTPDDIVAARLSRVLPIGVTAPEDDASKSEEALYGHGAAAVIAELSKIERIIKCVNE